MQNVEQIIQTFDEHYAKISAEMKELQEIKTQYTEQQARQDSFQQRIEDMKGSFWTPQTANYQILITLVRRSLYKASRSYQRIRFS